MLYAQISSTSITLYNNTGDGNTWKTNTFLGDVLVMLEDTFSDGRFIRYAENADTIINPNAPTHKIWGMDETGRALLDLQDFLQKTKGKTLSLASIEEYRLSKDIGILYFRSKDGLKYECHCVRDVIFAILHYYAYNGYKLTQCKHCGKWFATLSLEFEYCDRISPCYNLCVAGKKLLSRPCRCEQAVRTITQKFKDRKRSIYNNWSINQNGDINQLMNCCDKYSALIKKSPTVQNLSDYQEYLYSNAMPKQERPNRRSGSFKRRLLGT